MNIKILTLSIGIVVASGLLLWNSFADMASDTPAYHGAADASAVESIDSLWFVLADDEENQIGLYRRDLTDGPVQRMDLRPFLNPGGKNPETDIEGVARVGDHLFWISSHGRNASGRTAEGRHRFFATKLVMDGDRPRLVTEGRPVTHLLQVLESDPRLAPFRITPASKLAPKQQGGLNIEGLTSTPQGTLWIGFRNPVPQGRALMVELLNPLETIQGAQPKLGDPKLLELGGLGIRGMTRIGDDYWILGGPISGEGQVRIFRWNGIDTQPMVTRFESATDLRWEGISHYSEGGQDYLWLVSDDGTVKINGVEAKKLKNPLDRTFRAHAIRLDSPELNPAVDRSQGNAPSSTAPSLTDVRSSGTSSFTSTQTLRP